MVGLGIVLGLLGVLVSIASFALAILGVFYIIDKLNGKKNIDPKSVIEKESAKWQSKGIINAKQKSSILELYKGKEKQKPNTIKTLSTIGALILGLGVILFVASNWQRMSNIFRTVLLLAVTFGTLLLGYYFRYQRQDYLRLGKTLIFLSTLFWGASLALIYQIYNISVSNNWNLFLFWGIPAILVAYLLDSKPSFILGSVVLASWGIAYSISTRTANYFYPLVLFIALLPLSKEEKYKYWTNIVCGLIVSLIAIFGKYQWTVLLFSLGFLVYFIWQKKERYIISSSIAFVLWNIVFFISNSRLPNYFFILPFVFLVYYTYKANSKIGLAVNILSLILWVNLLLAAIENVFLHHNFIFVFMIVMHTLLGLVIYLLGIAESDEEFSSIYKMAGFLVSLITVYILSFKYIFESGYGYNVFSSYLRTYAVSNSYFFANIFLGVIALLLFFANVFCLEGLKGKKEKYEMFMIAFVFISSLVILLNPRYIMLNLVIDNIALMLIAVVSLLYGFESKSAPIFNSGIGIFVIFIITRYFDLFWAILDRSLFFIIGGAIMIIFAVYLEKKRREVVGGMGKKK